MARVRLAADIGGTFTDVALEVDGRLRTAKVLTTPASPADAVIDGVGKVLADAAVAPQSVEAFIHGTTLATNALIERRGAKTALITTAGMRDAVEMAHENRFEQYDLYMRRPEPLVPRHRRIGITQRHAADGTELLALDEDAVREAAAALRADGVESVAVGYLHSYINASHERRTREILAECWDGVPVSLSSEVCGEIREYERFSTVCANAYIAPLMRRYLTELNERLADLGMGCEMLLMQSGGGLGTLADALSMPVRLIESGPAGGALLASQIASNLGVDRALSFDMGGTTAKLCLIEDGVPHTSREFEVGREYRYLPGSGLPLRLPVIEMVEIGAGGSSIARVDQLGQIAVGPRSAGADPGPACYGLGGTQPTVTDADVLLGRLLPHRFAGGELLLDAAAARAAVNEHLMEPGDFSQLFATLGIAAVVDEHMSNAARTHASEQGSDVTDATLIAFGGAGPVHAAAVAAKLGITDIVVTADAGVGSAVGFLRAPAAHESVRTRHRAVADLERTTIAALLDEMEAESTAVVAAAAPGEPTVTALRVLMRYRGQGHEITVNVDPTHLRSHTDDEQMRAALTEHFLHAYTKLYSRAIEGGEIEVLSWLLTVRTPVPDVSVTDPELASAPSEPTSTATVTDAETGESADWAVFERAELAPGAHLVGPALVVEDQTTTLVPPGATAAVIGGGHLRVTLAARSTAMGAAGGDELAELRMGIQWNRLIGVVEEQARALVKAAFSTSTREAGDLSAGIFDTSGRMLAQSVTGTPGHVNSMAYSVLHFLEKFPPETMRPGDIFLTNDPWKGTGHLFDIVVVTPTFRDDKLVALFACTSHVVDIGGLGFTTDSNEVFHEGLYLPLMHFAKEGQFDPNVVAIIEANVRDPVAVVGDIYSLAACNETGARRLLAMMDEYALSDLDALASHIISRSRAAMLAEIRALPRGTWHNQMTVDGIDEPIDLVCSLTVTDDGIDVDYTGTSSQSPYGINVPMAYTDAYTSFGVRCIVGPHVPNNTGSLDVINVTAPTRSILNAPHPAAVAVRHVMGQMLPDTVFGCLAQAVPERVPAEGTSALWFVLASGSWLPPGKPEGDAATERFILLSFHSGGAGARPKADGLSATAFPSGVRNMPVEVNEIGSPLVFWRKEFRADSGGVGRYRGGLGQVIELENRQGGPFTISATYERVEHPARGRQGGGPGATGWVSLDDGTPVNSKGRSTIAAGRRLVIEFPGGAGWGDPSLRDPAAIERDLQATYVTSSRPTSPPAAAPSTTHALPRRT